MKKALGMLLLLFLIISCRTPEEQYWYEYNTTVYVTDTGDKYHRSTCQYLYASKISMKLGDAVKEGYTACSVCNPPRFTVNPGFEDDDGGIPQYDYHVYLPVSLALQKTLDELKADDFEGLELPSSNYDTSKEFDRYNPYEAENVAYWDGTGYTKADLRGMLQSRYGSMDYSGEASYTATYYWHHDFETYRFRLEFRTDFPRERESPYDYSNDPGWLMTAASVWKMYFRD